MSETKSTQQIAVDAIVAKLRTAGYTLSHSESRITWRRDMTTFGLNFGTLVVYTDGSVSGCLPFAVFGTENKSK
jgi:hypothetical protein